MDGDRFRSVPTPSVFATWKEYRRLGEVLRRRNAVLEGVPDIFTRWNFVLFAAIASGLRRKPLRTSIISLMDVKAAPGTYKLLAGLASFARRWFRADVRLQALPQPFRLWTDGLENPVIEEIGAGTEAPAPRRCTWPEQPVQTSCVTPSTVPDSADSGPTRSRVGHTIAISPRPASSAVPTPASSGRHSLTWQNYAVPTGSRRSSTS